MDPFSISVGIVGLIEVTIKTISLAKSFTREVSESGEAARAVVSELEILKPVLEDLGTLIRDGAFKDVEHNGDSALASGLKACQAKICCLEDRLNRATASRYRKLLWPFTKLKI